MAKGVCVAKGERMAKGDICGEGGGACVARGCAWQVRRPLQRTVRILLECILVDVFLRLFFKKSQ